MTKLLSIGADPEVLLQAETGQFVSAVGRLPGTKTEPYPVILGAVQVDNVTAEFNIAPAITAKEFDDHIEIVYDQMMHILHRTGARATSACVAEFSDMELTPECKISGCDPDWNAYTQQLNTPPDYESTNMRAAGGHVHIGVDMHGMELLHLAKVCDLLITLPMLVAEDHRRRALYGKAGSFRVKPYGMEYRTPSNHWIFNPTTRRWVHDRVDQAVSTVGTIEIPEDLWCVIDTHDLNKAEEYITAFGLSRYPIGKLFV